MNKEILFDFCKFLKEKNIYTNYIINVKTRHKSYFREHIFSMSPSSLIDGGFSWSNTKEGYDFWASISRMWFGEIVKKNYKKNDIEYFEMYDLI